MLGSGMWTPKVPSKKQQGEPDLDTTGLHAAVEKAVHSSLQKIGSRSKQSRNKNPSNHPSSTSQHCIHCDENSHNKDNCPNKDKKWYEVPPKGTQYFHHHWTKCDGKKPVKFCTTCTTWRYDDNGGHLAKDHATWKKTEKEKKKTSNTNTSRGRRNRSRKKNTPAANVTTPEDEDHPSEEEENDDATVGFTALFGNNWI
eukprot:6199805-Ditylum_brightwellii.AAC.1